MEALVVAMQTRTRTALVVSSVAPMLTRCHHCDFLNVVSFFWAVSFSRPPTREIATVAAAFRNKLCSSLSHVSSLPILGCPNNIKLLEHTVLELLQFHSILDHFPFIAGLSHRRLLSSLVVLFSPYIPQTFSCFGVNTLLSMQCLQGFYFFSL